MTEIAELHQLMRCVAIESCFTMFEPDEIPTHETLERIVETQRKTQQGEIFLAKSASHTVGYTTIQRGMLDCNRGVGTLTFGVCDSYQGRGIGSALMEAVIDWSKQHDVYRLQLDVHVDNHRAIALYTKYQFRIEGTMHRCVKIAGQFADKYRMALLF
ncbi:MAG: GNAT family N-acetyltransferase [Minisyncoccota bacterium]